MAGLVAKKLQAPVDPAAPSGDPRTAIGRKPAAPVDPAAPNVTGDPRSAMGRKPPAPVDPAATTTVLSGDPRSGMGRPPVSSTVPGGLPTKPQVQTMTAAGGVTGDSHAMTGATPGKPAVAAGGADPAVPAGNGAVDARIAIAQKLAGNAAAKTAPAAAAGTTAANDGPLTRELNQSTDTVAGQLATLTSGNNPIIDQARAAALKAANDRGMANSSMAAQSGEEAAIASMMPVAQQDASTSFQQGRANQDTTNQFTLTDKTFQHQNEMQGRDIDSAEKIAAQNRAAAEASAAASRELGMAQISASKEMQAASIAASDRQQQFAANTQMTLADKQIAANAGMFDKDASLRRELNLQGIQANTQTNYTAQVTAILSNHDMGQEDKDAAIRNLNAIYAGSPFMPPGINISHLPPYAPPNTSNGRPPPDTSTGG
jgi:hypothetical protein